MNYKLYILKEELRENGFFYALKRVILYLLRPITNLMKRSIFLVNLRYGVFPNLKQHLPFCKSDSKMVKLPQSELVQEVRKFWYSNVAGDFDLDGEKISRKDIFTYGGPNPKFTCPICQKSEWLSRVRQKNLFISHSCAQANECQTLCSRQGNELWTHFHQNFDFSIGCNPNLPSPKCLYIESEGEQRFLIPCCDQGRLIFRRRLTYACQINVVAKPVNINWHNYDFLFMINKGSNQKFSRPDIPIILYGYEFWPNKTGFQWVIDWVQPDVLLTPYPTLWRENFRIPDHTKIVFYPFFGSLFFTRPNLNEKKLDLLVIGAISSPLYSPRRLLDKQILQLPNYYKIEFSHALGCLRAKWKGAVCRENPEGGPPVRYLNKWSEYLGSAKYVIFGRIKKYPILAYKYYETLGSGAIPIFPEVPDLELLGVKPFEHYIPLSEVEGNNQKLAYYLDNYEKFRYIARNAVNWYKKVSDKMIFSDFEDMIREITNFKYPKRLI